MKRNNIKLSKIIKRTLSLILGLSIITVLLPLAAVPAEALEDDDEDPDTFLIDVGPGNITDLKTTYYDGEALDLTGLVVIGTYSDFSERELSDYTAEPAHGTILLYPEGEEGEVLQRVHITYMQDETEYGFYIQISVYPAPDTPNPILISIGPDYPDSFRFEYTDGEALDLSGLRLFGTYSDFSERELTGFTTDPVHGTILHCPADETDGVIILVFINYSEAGVDYGFDVQLTIYPRSTTGPDTSYPPGNTPPAGDDGDDDLTDISDGPTILGGLWDNPFSDVSILDWFYADVGFAYEAGLMIGTDTDDAQALFSPDVFTTRGMVVTVLYRMYSNLVEQGYEPDDQQPDAAIGQFADVPEGAYYYDAVLWAAVNDIVRGYGDGRFGPDDNVSRQDLAVILMRYAALIKHELPEAREYQVFADNADIGEYALEAVAALYMAEIINGREGGSFDPKGQATRAEVAAMLHRFSLTMEEIAEQAEGAESVNGVLE